MKQSSNPNSHACAIPYRIAGGRVEVCIVTTVRKQRWVFPKGYVEDGETEAEAALKEAFEEAGLIGRIAGNSVGSYERRKLGLICRVACYLMQVEECQRAWDESSVRRRRWVPASEALAELGQKEQRSIYASILRRLERRRPKAG
ncbi:MAG: NUDIX hydrolase [Planctomycetia bacterium]|nr:NUDIX hydrolase [Planctomycetia bacterium]